MNKEKPTALGFQRKPYAKPHINVVNIKRADIICTSGNTLTPYGGEEWEDNYLTPYGGVKWEDN